MSDMNSLISKEVLLSDRQIVDIAIQLAIGAVFVIASLRILRPFMGPIVAGGGIAIAVYPLFLRMVERLRGRRKTVVALFTLVGVGAIVVPAILASSSLFDSAHALHDQVEAGTLELPPPPPKIRDWPMIGTEINEFWLQATGNLQSFVNKYRDQMRGVVGDIVAAVAGAGAQALQFIFSILIAAVFLANAEACAEGVGLVSRRVFGEVRGREYDQLAAQTVRSVATGGLGVAFVQAALAGVGMMIADVPFVGAWSLAILLLAIVQLPPLIILVPIALWVLGSADNQIIAWGFMVWAILVSFSDAVLKPMFLGRGVDIPMIVILIGAIGGVITGGLIGLFVGAVILALAYRLLVEWLKDTAEELAPSPAVPEEGA